MFRVVAVAAVVGRLTVPLYSLPPRRGRGVIFSTGTRNSFVVLPLALALRAQWQPAVAVIVIQAFVEMLGMLVLIRLVPGWLLRESPSKSECGGLGLSRTRYRDEQAKGNRRGGI